MKKVFIFLISVSLVLGLFLGIREYMLNKEDSEDVINQDTINENYIGELKLPLIEVDSLNPLFTKNRQVAYTLNLIYEPLIAYDSSNKLSPKLSTEWAQKDEITWIVKLRENVKWHSNKDFTADDVIFTINTILQNQQSIYYQNVSNIENLDKLSNNSISITLKVKDEYLPYKLTFPILPKYYLFEDVNNIEKLKRPVGTGMYKFVEISNDEFRTTLTYNDNWWNNSTNKLETIYLYKFASYGEAIKAFKSSEIDLISTSMSSWKKKFGVIGINSYSYENAQFETIIPNTQRNSLSESSVRRAILYAINRNNIINEVYEGNANTKDVMIHEYSWLYDKNTNIEYSPEKAKQLLLNAGWNQSNSGWQKNMNGKNITLKFEMLVKDNSEEHINVAQIIKENLAEIGVTLNVKKVSATNYKANIEQGNFDLALATIELQNEYDIIDLLKNKNYSRYENEQINNLLEKLYMNNISIVESFKKMQATYRNEIPYIGLYFRTDTLLTNKAVKGQITPTWYSTYHNIQSWCK
ncbi:MAG: peptide ABC transporter substrate-binding protein [Clostridia bacterium]|nr:peptide ABC transporter substrate-binding protein [Clostridia bacterium]